MPASFSGFSPETIKFLVQLRRNNNRDWFNKNKSRYEDHVLAPSLEFITAMQAPLAQISPTLVASPKRVGGSLMRIYRDTRFSKDKTPYKTNVGIHFRHQAGCDVHAPGLYFHVEPGECFLGAGIWHPDTKSQAAIRRALVEDSVGWKKALGGKAYRQQFQLAGDSLKRPPRGFDADHPLIDDLKRKDFIAVAKIDEAFTMDSKLVQNTTKAFRSAAPLIRFLCGALNQPF